MDYEEVEQKWKTAKLYFRDYKRCSRPFKKHVLPDVRNGQDIYDDAGASASDAILHPQEWDDDYSMGH